MEPKEWTPSKFLNDANSEFDDNYAIIVLNRPINLAPLHTRQLWEKAKCRCLVDGGANRWLDFLEKYHDLGSFENPELLTGDFDSITEQTMQHFKDLSASTIIHTPNEDYTDFTKALMELSPYIISDNIGSVLTLLDTSGRIDHIFAHINTLVKAQIFLENVSIFILSSDSISWLLNAGHHVIHIPQEFVDKKIWCSFVPIDGKCCVSTTGFKWNLVSLDKRCSGPDILFLNSETTTIDRCMDFLLFCIVWLFLFIYEKKNPNSKVISNLHL